MSTDLKTFYENEVPDVDSTDNNWFVDVLGQKGDTHNGKSIYALLHEMNDHLHTPSKVYPTLADGVVVTAGAAWTLGAFAEIVPINTITSDFDIHHISIESLSANEVYELALYYGPTDIECGRTRITKNANQDGTMNIPILTSTVEHKPLPANSRIRAKLATAGGTDTATISIFYHPY